MKVLHPLPSCEVLLSDPSDFVGGINCFDGDNEPRQVRVEQKNGETNETGRFQPR